MSFRRTRVETYIVATIDLSTAVAYLLRMAQRDQLQKIQDRIGIVLDHLSGKSVSAIARERGGSRPTVRKWIERFDAEGVEGLLSRSSPGRPREISPELRREVVRVTLEARPPPDLGEQWTTRLLGEVFGISSSHISNIWEEEGIDPPLHLQQVKKNPNRTVRLRIDLSVAAWFKMNLIMHLDDHGWTLEEYLLARLVGDAPPGHLPPWEELREQALGAIRDDGRQQRWWRRHRDRPVVDPRQPEYLVELKRRMSGED